MPTLDDGRFLQLLGTRLRKARESHGWTQIQLGELAELDRTFVGAIERGQRNISILKLRVLAKKLRVRLGDLLKDLD